MSDSVPDQGKNQVAGTWEIVSAQADPDGDNVPLFGPNPTALLVFTEDLRFVEVLNNPDVPKFASNDLSEGTEAENKAAVSGALGIYGTYTVDEQGSFLSEHVIGSTFPNWNGLDRDRNQLTMTVEGDTMTERLHDPGGPQIVIVWRRVN